MIATSHSKIVDRETIEQVEAFWSARIDFSDSSIQLDHAPFIVMEDTAMSKLHFIFIMLNVSIVNVVKKGRITGVITKNEFMKKRSEETELNKNMEAEKHAIYGK